MEPSISLGLDVLKILGIPGLLVIFWYFDKREVRRVMDEGRQDLKAVLEQYRNDMQEQRLMYQNNVELVRSYQSIALDLKNIVILNTQKWAETDRSILNNQYCPMVRLDKQAHGKQIED